MTAGAATLIIHVPIEDGAVVVELSLAMFVNAAALMAEELGASEGPAG